MSVLEFELHGVKKRKKKKTFRGRPDSSLKIFSDSKNLTIFFLLQTLSKREDKKYQLDDQKGDI